MKKAFAETLTELASEDNRIVLLTGDLGFMTLEPFAAAHPARFINVGVAEQNMVGVATGMAEAGFIPFVYSIGPFAVARPFEFIKLGPVAHRRPVRIVGVGAGVDYANNGITHYNLEDIALCRTQPGLKIVCPADNPGAREAIRKTWCLPCPIYYRLGKDDLPAVPGMKPGHPDRLQVIGNGKDALLLALGTAARDALEAAEALRKDGVETTVAVISALNPGPEAAVARLIGKFDNIQTVEHHYRAGGLGSWVAEIMAERGLKTQQAGEAGQARAQAQARLARHGFRTLPAGKIGDRRYMLEAHALSGTPLVKAIKKKLGRKKGA